MTNQNEVRGLFRRQETLEGNFDDSKLRTKRNYKDNIKKLARITIILFITHLLKKIDNYELSKNPL